MGNINVNDLLNSEYLNESDAIGLILSYLSDFVDNFCKLYNSINLMLCDNQFVEIKWIIIYSNMTLQSLFSLLLQPPLQNTYITNKGFYKFKYQEKDYQIKLSADEQNCKALLIKNTIYIDEKTIIFQIEALLIDRFVKLFPKMDINERQKHINTFMKKIENKKSLNELYYNIKKKYPDQKFDSCIEELNKFRNILIHYNHSGYLLYVGDIYSFSRQVLNALKYYINYLDNSYTTELQEGIINTKLSELIQLVEE